MRWGWMTMMVLVGCESPGAGGRTAHTNPDATASEVPNPDASETAPDATSLEETAALEDTFVADSTVPETSADTFVVDASVPETSGDTADDTSVDTFVADTSAPDNGPEVVADPCPTLALASLSSPAKQVFEMQTDGLGSPNVPDVIRFEFFSPDFGIYDLGAGVNTDYATCNQCVTVLQDREQPVFYQARGTLTIYPLSEPMGQVLAGSIAGLELYEVTINPSTFHTTAVPNGRCVKVADGQLLGF